MPFRSEAQRKYLFANKPDVARKFAEHTPDGASLPEHVARERKPAKRRKMVGTIGTPPKRSGRR